MCLADLMMTEVESHRSIPGDVSVIRSALKSSSRTIVRMECFNQIEIVEMRELLTPEERKRTHFTWVFSNPDQVQDYKCECDLCEGVIPK